MTMLAVPSVRRPQPTAAVNWLYPIAALLLLAMAAVAIDGSLGNGLLPAGDYFGVPNSGSDAAGMSIGLLARGNLHAFFLYQPVMGPVSLLLRVPIAAAGFAGGWSEITIYRLGALACFVLAAVLLIKPLKMMLERGLSPLWVAALAAAIALSPVVGLKALLWGHPEEPLAGALCVFAVLSVRRRPLLAGVMLGLAIATKQWALLAVIPALAVATPAGRRNLALAAVASAGVLLLPMLIGDPSRFLHQQLSGGEGLSGVEQTSLWWPLHHLAYVSGVQGQLEIIPNWIDRLTHPLTLALALGLSVLFWRRSDRSPVDALGLVALLFLLRCWLDPLTISYHHGPYLIAVCCFSGLRRNRAPALAFSSVLALLVIDLWLAPNSGSNGWLLYGFYTCWATVTCAWLGKLVFSRREERPRAVRSAVSPGALNTAGSQAPA